MEENLNEIVGILGLIWWLAGPARRRPIAYRLNGVWVFYTEWHLHEYEVIWEDQGTIYIAERRIS